MLAISMAPTAPHLLPQFEMADSVSVFSAGNGPSLGFVSSTTRPKLSLKTSGLNPTFGGPTGARNHVNCTATATPTALNTLANAFDLTYRPSPVASLSPGAHFLGKTTGHPLSPATKRTERPYSQNLPFGVHPILKNTPLPRDARRPSTCSAGTSPRIALRRVVFPLPKKVTFCTVLEEIVTKDYVKCHADLSSSEEESSSSEAEEPSTTEANGGEAQRKDRAIRVDEYSLRGRRRRKTVSIADRSSGEIGRGRDGISRRSSSRRSRRKLRRWEWTLETARVIEAEDVKLSTPKIVPV